MIANTLVLRSTTTVRATTQAGASRPNRRYAGDRTCEVPTCTTQLSVYNPRRRCWAHAEPRPSIARVRQGSEEGPVVMSLDELSRVVAQPHRHPEPPAEPQPEPFPQPGPVPSPEDPS